jgi:hypothetical protein
MKDSASREYEWVADGANACQECEQDFVVTDRDFTSSICFVNSICELARYRSHKQEVVVVRKEINVLNEGLKWDLWLRKGARTCVDVRLKL